jgi:UDP-N-acetylmuramoylalanine--D-glutamate ligase
MLEKLKYLRNHLAGKRVGVVGLGIVGKAVAAHLLKAGAHVIALDTRDVMFPGIEVVKADTSDAKHLDAALQGIVLLIISPGVDPRTPLVQQALVHGIAVCGELALIDRFPARLLSITGTNGKSTTTALAGAMLQACGAKTFVGGNLGDPVIAWVDAKKLTDVAVLELSSYQLETAHDFRSDVAVVLNVTPDHADRYHALSDYVAAKQRLLEQLKPNGIAILSADDPQVVAMQKSTQARTWWFSTEQRAVTHGVVWDPQRDEVRGYGDARALDGFSLQHPRLIGKHNRENSLAALLGTHALGYYEGLQTGYQAFQGLEHRLEFVAEINGVLFINDSKATNDAAAAIGVTAVNSMDRPIILLVGGRDKGAGYARLLQASQKHVKQIVAFGEAKDLVRNAFAPSIATHSCETMQEALEFARSQAQSGDVVLLSPACSSFDAFTNYSERGRVFKEWVLAA